MSDNVVIFPRERKDAPPQTLDEMHKTIETLRKERIELAIDSAVPLLFMNLMQEGFDLTLNDDGVKDSAMIIESVRAALFRSMNFKHGLHSISDKLFVVKTNPDGTATVNVDEENIPDESEEE